MSSIRLHERKALMADLADAFIALPGGLGTLEELAEVVSWAQLELHAKPIGLLEVGDYWTLLLAWLDMAVAEGFVAPAHRRLVTRADSLGALLDAFEALAAAARSLGDRSLARGRRIRDPRPRRRHVADEVELRLQDPGLHRPHDVIRHVVVGAHQVDDVDRPVPQVDARVRQRDGGLRAEVGRHDRARRGGAPIGVLRPHRIDQSFGAARQRRLADRDAAGPVRPSEGFIGARRGRARPVGRQG